MESEQEQQKEEQEPIGDPPATLEEVASNKWRQMSSTLKHLTIKDRAILEQFCSAYVLRKLAEKKIDEQLEGDFKPMELNSINSVFKNSSEVCLKSLHEMQATPLAREKKKPSGEQENGGKRKKLPQSYRKFFG